METEEDVRSLNIDIALADRKHTITLFASSDPVKLAQDFANENNLSAKNTKTLTMQLQQNIREHFGE